MQRAPTERAPTESMTEPREMPMFPLGNVLFPFAVLPLHVFEPRYRALVEQVVARDHEFGVVLIERGHEVGGGDVRFSVGTLARIIRLAQSSDGRYLLTTVGTRRIRVTEWLDDAPYPRARVVDLDDIVEGELREQRSAVERLLREVAALWVRLDPRASGLEIELAADPVSASYEAAALAPIGPLDAQAILETDDVAERFRLLGEALRNEIDVLHFRLGGSGPAPGAAGSVG
jgi:uncharacterized protein